MEYFDFQTHWCRFLGVWNSDLIQAMLEELLRTHGFIKHGQPWTRGTPLASLTDATYEEGSVESMILPHGCHVYAPASLIAASEMYPNNTWVLVDGNAHSTVVSIELHLVFDLLCWYYYHKQRKTAFKAVQVFEMCVGRTKGLLYNSNVRYITSSEIT